MELGARDGDQGERSLLPASTDAGPAVGAHPDPVEQPAVATGLEAGHYGR